MLNRKASRNALLAGVGSTGRRTGAANRQNGRTRLGGLSSRGAEPGDDDESQTLLLRRDGYNGLGDDSEQDGSYDTGWKSPRVPADPDYSEEQASLLEEGRILDGSHPLDAKGRRSRPGSVKSIKTASLGQPRTIPFNAPGTFVADEGTSS